MDVGGYFQLKWLRIRLLKRTIPEEEKEKKGKRRRRKGI